MNYRPEETSNWIELVKQYHWLAVKLVERQYKKFHWIVYAELCTFVTVNYCKSDGETVYVSQNWPIRAVSYVAV